MLLRLQKKFKKILKISKHANSLNNKRNFTAIYCLNATNKINFWQFHGIKCVGFCYLNARY